MTAKLATIRLRGAGALAAVLLGGSCAVQPRPAPPAQTASLSPVDSIRVYTAACGQGLATSSSLSPGSATACTNLGRMYRDGRGVEQNPGRAVELFTRVCDGMPAHPDDQDAAAAAASACSLLGAQYAHGSGVPEDWGRAIALSRQGCDGGDAFGCFNLGDLGEPLGCFNLANHYTDGTGVKADPARAAALYAQACSAGYEAACAKASPAH
jgi:TPR repeat protein